MRISLKNVGYVYNKGTASECAALEGVSLEIVPGEFIAVAGNTGSGKSTLAEILNGLLLPDKGEVLYNGENIRDDRKRLRDIRLLVSLAFQYPQYQIFSESVIKDVEFGPLNKGYSKELAREKAEQALLMAGIEKGMLEKSPFDLSGGEMKRVSLAGIIAMEPEILILDEPTAGLDPSGRKKILEIIKKYQAVEGRSVIMISHNMDEILEYAERLILLKDGKLIADGKVKEIFMDEELLRSAGLCVPEIMKLCMDLEVKGPLTSEDAADAIYKKYGSGGV